MSSVLIEKISDAELWVTEMIRQQVLNHRTCHGECPTSELTIQRWCGTISWWQVADRRCWRLAMSDVGMQQLTVAPCLVSTGGPWLLRTGLVEGRPKVQENEPQLPQALTNVTKLEVYIFTSAQQIITIAYNQVTKTLLVSDFSVKSQSRRQRWYRRLPFHSRIRSSL